MQEGKGMGGDYIKSEPQPREGAPTNHTPLLPSLLPPASGTPHRCSATLLGRLPWPLHPGPLKSSSLQGRVIFCVEIYVGIKRWALKCMVVI